jgi:hypothetical protein
MNASRMAIALVSTAAWLLLGPPARGCECVSQADGTPSLSGYSTIFLGTVQSIQEIEIDGVSRRRVVLSVERTWRGGRTSTRSVETGWGGPDCGYVFERDKRYVVTATPCPSRKGGLCVDSCGLTMLEEGSAALIERLDREFRGSSVKRAK